MPYIWDGNFGPDDPCTQDSVARRFAEEQAGALRYCAEQRAWYVFDGAIWRRDRTGIVRQRARALAREMGTDRDGEGRHGSGTIRFVAGVERFAGCDPTFAVTAEEFDADPFLLGTPDGPVALRAGRKIAADPSQNLSRATAVGPADEACCPAWLRFLDETFEDAALTGFLQRFCGYALTGDTSEQVLVFGHGTGGNGKSVLARTIAGLMGSYAESCAPDLLSGGATGRRHPTAIATLAGARLVASTETGAAPAWDDARVKLLTGGDPVTARFMRADAFTFTPRFKLLVLGNRRPSLARVDEAMRRRFLLLPFRHRPEVPDRTLAETLRREWPGILRWMIEGCLDWQANGLDPPPGIRDATADYLATQDVLGEFLGACCDCEPGDAGRSAPSGALFEAWSAFTLGIGEATGTQRAFSDALEARGFERRRSHSGRTFRGLALKIPDAASVTQ